MASSINSPVSINEGPVFTIGGQTIQKPLCKLTDPFFTKLLRIPKSPIERTSSNAFLIGNKANSSLNMIIVEL